MVLKLLNSTKQAHWASFVLLSLMLKILVIQLALIFVALYTVHPPPPPPPPKKKNNDDDDEQKDTGNWLIQNNNNNNRMENAFRL